MTPADRTWMTLAVELAHRCPHSDAAYAVGAVIVGADGTELARGYSRETDPLVHAEESALHKVSGSPLLAGATIYSTLEPCSVRKSRPRGCARLIIDAGLARVVIAWREPTYFVEGEGVELLAAAGIEVTELAEFADEARAPNAHLNL